MMADFLKLELMEEFIGWGELMVNIFKRGCFTCLHVESLFHPHLAKVVVSQFHMVTCFITVSSTLGYPKQKGFFTGGKKHVEC